MGNSTRFLSGIKTKSMEELDTGIDWLETDKCSNRC